MIQIIMIKYETSNSKIQYDTSNTDSVWYKLYWFSIIQVILIQYDTSNTDSA